MENLLCYARVVYWLWQVPRWPPSHHSRSGTCGHGSRLVNHGRGGTTPERVARTCALQGYKSHHDNSFFTTSTLTTSLYVLLVFRSHIPRLSPHFVHRSEFGNESNITHHSLTSHTSHTLHKHITHSPHISHTHPTSNPSHPLHKHISHSPHTSHSSHIHPITHSPHTSHTLHKHISHSPHTSHTSHTHPTSIPSLTHPTHPTLSTSTSHTHHSLICICRSARPVSISESLNGSGIPLRGRDCSDRLPPFPWTAACRYLPERERERLRIDKF